MQSALAFSKDRKRLQGMAQTSFLVDQRPSWAVMLPEVLANIFNRLSFEEKMLLIPRVCRTWRRISQDFVCWQVVDLAQWSSGRSLFTIDRMIQMLLKRSHGLLREFSSQCDLGDATLKFIAISCASLEVLRIPYSGVTDKGAKEISQSLTCLTDLDISGCASLSRAGLEAFGEHCRSIIRLCRNTYHQMYSTSPSNEEAFAIAQCFPQLKHLELSYAPLSGKGLKAILDTCRSLEYLDLRGCMHLEMDETFIKECRARLKVFCEPVVSNDFLDSLEDQVYEYTIVSDDDSWEFPEDVIYADYYPWSDLSLDELE